MKIKLKLLFLINTSVRFESKLIIMLQKCVFFSGLYRTTSGETLPVAVKTLKDHVSPEAQIDFEKEVEIMSSFRHDNILKLLGVVIRGMCLFRYFHAHKSIPQKIFIYVFVRRVLAFYFAVWITVITDPEVTCSKASYLKLLVWFS